jgi:hypothetical protein
MKGTATTRSGHRSGGAVAAEQHLRRGFHGPVQLPGDGGYDAARATFRPALDPRPAPVAEALGPADVQAAVHTTYADSGSIGGTPPLRFELFRRLPDAVIAALVDAAGHRDAPVAAVEVRHWGGAMARPDADAGPGGHRDVPFSVTVAGPAEAAAPLAPYATGGSFLNFLGDPARTHTAYTPRNYQRLRELKRTYHPDNVFGLTHNIPPSTPALPDRQPYPEAR